MKKVTCEQLPCHSYYVMTGEVKNDLTRKINDAVERGRKNEMWRSDHILDAITYMEWMK